MISHTFTLADYDWVVVSPNYTPEVPARRGRGDRARKRLAPTVEIEQLVTRVHRSTGIRITQPYSMLKQALADELTGGDLDEAQEIIEADLVSAHHRSSADYKIKMRRARRRIFGQQQARARRTMVRGPR